MEGRGEANYFYLTLLHPYKLTPFYQPPILNKKITQVLNEEDRLIICHLDGKDFNVLTILFLGMKLFNILDDLLCCSCQMYMLCLIIIYRRNKKNNAS